MYNKPNVSSVKARPAVHNEQRVDRLSPLTREHRKPLNRNTHGSALRRSKHAPDKFVHVLLAVASIAALDEVVADARETADGAIHLERPQELGALLEVRPDRVNLMNQILHADDGPFGL